MNFISKLFNKPKKKDKVDVFLELLNISNSSFQKISKQIEKSIFWGHDIINYEVPPEYQEDSILTKKNYDARFMISAGITGLAILEYTLKEKYDEDVYLADLIKTKKIIYSNILPIREEIIKFPIPIHFFEDDTEPSLINTMSAQDDFIDSVTQKSNFIKNLIERRGEYRNIYFHFFLVLGQVMPDKKRIFFGPDHAKIVDNKITEVVELMRYFFDELSLKEY